MSVDRAHKDAAAEWWGCPGCGRLGTSMNDLLRQGCEGAPERLVLVSELEAAQKEGDELKGWYEKVAPMTVPTKREAVAEKRVRELEAWGKQIHDALDGRPLPEYPDSAPARIAALVAAVSATPTPTKENA